MWSSTTWRFLCCQIAKYVVMLLFTCFQYDLHLTSKFPYHVLDLEQVSG